MERRPKLTSEESARFNAAFLARMEHFTKADMRSMSMAQLRRAYRDLPMRIRREFWGPVNETMGEEPESKRAVKHFHNVQARACAILEQGATEPAESPGEIDTCATARCNTSDPLPSRGAWEEEKAENIFGFFMQ